MSPSAAARCASHPGRPAVDSCPVCDRRRCGADAAEWGARGCGVCEGGPQRPSYPPAGSRELLVRGTLAGFGTAVLGGLVAAQYVQAEYFEWFAPAVLGVGTAFAATAAAKNPRGVLGARLRLVVVLLSLLGTGLGFVLEGTFGVFSTSVEVLVPYAIAVAAAAVASSPPKPKRPA